MGGKKKMASDERQCFHGNKDRYGGVTVITEEEECKDDDNFEKMLKSSLVAWQQQGLRGIGLKISLRQSSFVPIAAKHGFVFHHSQPSYVLMTRWLPTDVPNLLPAFANHYIGVAGFVINDKNEVLVIQEKYGVSVDGKPAWKLPGGLANTGEDIPETAKREVFEETGIETEFISLLCFRQQHNFKFGQSDIYFICYMKPKTSEIKACPQEIRACQWMKLEDYANHPNVTSTNRFIIKCFMESAERDHKFQLGATPVLNYKKTGTNLIYSVLAQEAEFNTCDEEN
ncbi:nucleoside diphosphate-linked moiety X motif 6-like isoform X2 [Ptychodera flava]|uniref:nucleoside diphosphate-linked moiety X motif 6-like isoform X2 n=1 Tax=Ptychodera flava TaxID=63121 RepID=UPI00396A81BC